MLAGALALRLRPRRPMLTACLLLLTDVPLLLLLAAAAPVTALVAAGGCSGGAALSFGAVLWVSELRRRVPPHAQSRVFAHDQLGSISMLPLGLVGVLAEPLGAAATLTGIAVLHLALMAAAVGVRDTRTMTTAEPAGAPAATT